MIDWRKAPTLSEQTNGVGWSVEFIIDVNGCVTDARIISHGGPNPSDPAMDRYAPDALAAVQRMRWKPFTRSGKPTPIRFSWTVPGRPNSYNGPTDQSFPATPDPSTALIRLERSGCMGSCPVYQIEIRGDGSVRYVGREFVVVPGEHRWTIPRSSVTELIALFRKADYFKLDGYYVANVSDLPTYFTGLKLGSQEKFVVDYGHAFGEAGASVSMPGGPGLQMPSIVQDIEDAIDRLSGSKSWIKSDEHTFDLLRDTDFVFKSEIGHRVLINLANACNLDAARAVLAAGARGDGGYANWLTGTDKQAFDKAASCGDAKRVAELIGAKGLAKKDADALLETGVDRGFSGIVRIALQYTKVTDRQPYQDRGHPLLYRAAEVYPPDADEPAANVFDSGEVIRLLLAAGADPNVLNQYGETALEEANSEGAARALFAGGTKLSAERLAKVAERAEAMGWTALLADIKNKAAAPPVR